MATRTEVVEGTATETALFLARRLRKLRTHISGVLNINPFLLCALKDFHRITDQQSLAEFMLIWHLGAGHSTSFGKMVDERILPNVFRTVRLDSTFRHQPPYNTAPFDVIDHLVHRNDGEFLLSLKASSWSIQYGMAMDLYRNFLELGAGDLRSSGIVVGVFYGHKALLTDKYRIVRGDNVRRQNDLQRLDYVDVKAGEVFWSWLNNDETATQDWILEGIEQGSAGFSRANTDMDAVVGGAATQLVGELRAKYGLPADGKIDWRFLLHAVNDDTGEEIGTEPIEPGPPNDGTEEI